MECKIRIQGGGTNIRVERECHKDDPIGFVDTLIAAMLALGVSKYELASSLQDRAEAIGGPDFAK